MPAPRCPSLLQRIAFAMLAGLSFAAPAAVRADTQTERLVLQVVLIRHGIRSPTKAPETLAVHASEAWPAWPVAPGQLTTHGARLMRSLGAWYRRELAISGIDLGGCGEASRLKLIADSTPRNRNSAAAMLRGLSPACSHGYRAFAPGHGDPLFRGSGDGGENLGDGAPTVPGPALAELQQVLLGCHDEACLAKARSAGKRTLLGAAPAKALKTAGTLSENLMLEYVQGFPPGQVGWGRLDAAGVGRIIALHNAQFAFAKKAPTAAQARGGNLLAHVAATLANAAGQATKLYALAPASDRALILLGHDTDLASQAGLLGLDWHNAAQPDDYPPGGALIYQLVESHGAYAVRLRIALPTLAALRAGDVAGKRAMHVAPLPLPGCGHAESCPLASFLALVEKAVGSDAVVEDTGDEPRVP